MAIGKLLIFNPSHELALAANSPAYTPPKAIADMEKRMARFPQQWAKDGDIVLTDWHTTYPQLVRQAGHPLIPEPWGWNRAIRQQLLRIGTPTQLMPSEQQLDTWRQCASRQFAAQYIQQFLQCCPSQCLAGQHMRFYNTAEEFIQQALPNTTYILKPEFSVAGRGHRLFHLPLSPHTTLPKQPFLADRFIPNKQLDCALLFFIERGGQVKHLGYSVFHTNPRGQYLHQEQLPQPQLKQLIAKVLGDAEDLDSLTQLHQQLLARLLAPHYDGYVGIDMLVAHDPSGRTILHPCLELNLRMTMGIAQLRST